MSIPVVPAFAMQDTVILTYLIVLIVIVLIGYVSTIAGGVCYNN